MWMEWQDSDYLPTSPFSMIPRVRLGMGNHVPDKGLYWVVRASPAVPAWFPPSPRGGRRAPKRKSSPFA